MSPTPTPEAVIRRFFAEVYNQGQFAALDEIIAPTYQDFGHTPPGVGFSGALSDVQGLYSAFDEIQYQITDLIVSDDRVAVQWTGHMRHIGPFFGIPATGRHVTYAGMSFYTVRDGRIVTTRNIQDMYAIFQQLGSYPTLPVG